MAVLMASVFTVSIGYGVVLPLLPYLIERLLGTVADAAQVSRSTGLLTGLYTLALFLFAPAWGHMSDRYGRRAILLIGLLGFSATMLTFAFIENLTAVYAERFLSGMFAAAVTPGALATIGDLATTDEARARRLTFVSLAGISGFLLGPMLGVFIARSGAGLLPSGGAGALTLPLAGTAVLANGESDPLALALIRKDQAAITAMDAALAQLPRRISLLRAENLVGMDALRRFAHGETTDADGVTAVAANRSIKTLPELGHLIDEIERPGKGLIMLMGKGGVGKTTMAAAVAAELAARGHDVLLTTTDPAALQSQI